MFVMEEMLEHLGPKRAADLVLLSREIDAGEALAAGLLSRVVAAGEVEATADAMAAELDTQRSASKPSSSVAISWARGH